MDQAKANEVGALIGAALARRRGDSQRAAATRAGVHESWWRQVVAGGVKKGDLWVPVKAKPETYLAMAAAVGVEAEVRALLGDEVPVETVRPAPEDDAIRHQRPPGISDSDWALIRRLNEANYRAMIEGVIGERAL